MNEGRQRRGGGRSGFIYRSIKYNETVKLGRKKSTRREWRKA